MKSFLEYVAADLLEKYGTDLSHVALVFPNKRASLFTNTHLAKLAKQPVWTPSYITISDFFRKQSSLTVADDMKLVCDLYKSYIKCTGKNETLDHFYSWGQLLLSDFDDIDIIPLFVEERIESLCRAQRHVVLRRVTATDDGYRSF